MRFAARFALPVTLLLAGATFVSACSSDTKESVDSVKEQAADQVGEAAARTAGEAFRVALKADDAAQEKGVRSVDVLKENAKDLPGHPSVTGIDDADGDGLDDDGKVEVKVSDKVACVTLPESGTEVDVTDGSC